MADADMNAVLEKLAANSTKQEEYLRDMRNDSTEQTASLRSIGGAFSAFKVVSALIQKLVAVTVGNALKFDKMAVANSDININLKHTTRSMDLANVKFGTAVDHLNTTIQLHRIGYKKIDAGLRDSLVLLDKQGGQGQEVVAFMGQLLQLGASQKTQVEIAKEIAKVANNTTTTARATMGALEQTADLVPIFKALGLEGDMLKNLTQLTADMPKDAAIALGKHFKELIHPSDIKKSMLIGGIEFGNALLNNRGFKDFEKIMRTSAPHMAQSISEFMPLFGDNVITLSKAMDIGFGDAAKFAQAAEEAFDVADKASKHQIENTERYQTGQETYAESMMAIADKFDRIFDVAMIEALDGFKPILKQLNAAFDQWLSGGDLFSKMESYGDKLHVWTTAVAKFIADWSKTNLADYLKGDISLAAALYNRPGALSEEAEREKKNFNSRKVGFTGWGADQEARSRGEYSLTDGGFRNVMLRQNARTTDPADVGKEFKSSFGEVLMTIQQLAVHEKFKVSADKDFIVRQNRRNDMLNSMGDMFGVRQLGGGMEQVAGSSRNFRKAEAGRKNTGFLRFPEGINDTEEGVKKAFGATDTYKRLAAAGWVLKKRVVGKDVDWELHDPGGASMDVWIDIAENLGLIVASEEEAITQRKEIITKSGNGNGNGGAPKSRGRKGP